MLQKRVNLFGLFIDDINVEEAMELARNALKGSKPLSFVTPNLEMLHGARVSEGARGFLNGADVALPDGIGLKAVAVLLGVSLKNRVAGIDFGTSLLTLCERERARVFLLGGFEKTAHDAAEALQKKYPDLCICGTRHGYFDEAEAQDVCELINKACPDVLIVCRGFPRQEKFVFLHRSALSSVKVFACLGGSLDVWSGNVRRAPLIFRKCGLEWLWRIANEPQRLDRFLLTLPTLAKAFEIGFYNRFNTVFGTVGIKIGKRAYNQVKK